MALRAGAEKPGVPASQIVRNRARPRAMATAAGGATIRASVAASSASSGPMAAPAWEPTLGTNANLGDDVAEDVSIGFPFTFYGREYEMLYLSSNGNVTLNKDSYDYMGRLPYQDFALIAAATGDWQPDSGTMQNVFYATVGEAPHRRFVVTWNDVRLYRPRTEAARPVHSTFQLQLLEGANAIQFGYKEIGETQPDIRVGISSGTGDFIRTAEGEQVAALQGTNLCYAPDADGHYQVSRTVCSWPVRIASAGGPYAGVEGAAIAFDGSASADPSAGELAYAWDFGDGATAAGTATPSHVYLDGGSFKAALHVVDRRGKSGSDTAVVTVANADPVADLGADATITSGETFAVRGTFSDAGARDMPWAYAIDWGNGARATGSTADQSATIGDRQRYLAAGTYAVVVKVTDKDGGAGLDTLALTVRRLPVVLDVLPHQKHNTIALGGKGDDDEDGYHGEARVSVAILSTATFDASQVYPASAVLGSTPLVPKHHGRGARGKTDDWRYDLAIRRQDVNHDRRPDLILYFRRADLIAHGDLTRSTTSLTLLAETFDGRQIEGSDQVRVAR
jgi:hypothetical protein